MQKYFYKLEDLALVDLVRIRTGLFSKLTNF